MGGALAWDTAIAGDEPIIKYEIREGEKTLGEVLHYPQTTKKPFIFEGIDPSKNYTVVAVDRLGRENS